MTCDKVITIPQFKGTCWFNAVLMAMFYSQGMRTLLLQHIPSWDKKNKVFAIFKDILEQHYTHENNEYMTFFKKFSPSRILAELHKTNPSLFEVSPTVQDGYYGGRYLFKLIRYLGVDKLAILDAIQTQGRKFDLFYGQYNAMHIHENKKVYAKHDKDTVQEYFTTKPDVLMIMTKKKTDKKFYPEYYYQQECEFMPTITFHGQEYVSDALLLSNYNMNMCHMGHEIAGVTCNGDRYMYNGWLHGTKDQGIKQEISQNIPCSLMKYDWLDFQNKNFCINTKDCNLKFNIKDDISALCFHFSRGSRIYTYIRKDLLQSKKNTPVKTKPVKKNPTQKDCPPGKILNPNTNRCVKIDGKIGKQLIKKKTEKNLIPE